MNIIFSTYDSLGNPHYGGGGAVAIHAVAKRLAQQHKVTIYTYKFPSSTNQFIDGVLYKRIGLAWLTPKLGQLLFQFLLPWHVMRANFDMWFESFTPPFASAFLPFFTRKPVVGITHFLDAEEKSKEYHLPFTWIQNLGIPRYKYIITLTNSQKKKIQKISPRTGVAIIPNATDIVPARQVLTKPGNYILYIGRIEIAQKGLDLLLQSFEKVITKQKLQLYIAGSGSDVDEKKLVELIRERHLQNSIKILGRVEGKKKTDLIRNAQCLVVPSRFEGQSLTIIESIVLGTPIVCFDIEGMKWLVQAISLKAKPFDIDTFATHILKVTSSPSLRKKMSAAALLKAKEYSWDVIGDAYEQVTRLVTKKSMNYSVQVNQEHYDFASYVHTRRWGSYFHQIQGVLTWVPRGKQPTRLLEVGIGDKTVSTLLKLNNVKVTTLDIDPSLAPDYVDSLPELSSQKRKHYDCILCCEVLEHLQFQDVEKSFKKFSELTDHLIVSVPHAGGYASSHVQLWYLKQLTIKLFFPSPKTMMPFRFNGEHYWELGAPNFSTEKFVSLAEKSGFQLVRDYRIPEFLYHHIFFFEKK